MECLQARFPLPTGEWAVVAAGQPLSILVSGEQLLIGINAFQPGEEFPNHIHTTATETFIGVHGEVELWLDQSERVTLTPGVLKSVSPNQQHYLRNESAMPAMIVYVKAPNCSQDRVPIPWTPEGRPAENGEHLS